MPLYDYQCVDCRTRDQRLGALDDHTALCLACGGLMLRLDQDLFDGYFKPKANCPWCQPHEGTSEICLRHAADLKDQIAALETHPQPQGFLYQLRPGRERRT